MKAVEIIRSAASANAMWHFLLNKSSKILTTLYVSRLSNNYKILLKLMLMGKHSIA